MEGYNCIGCSPDNPFGLHLCFYEDGDDIVTTWKPSPLYQGWLNTLHGGIQALLPREKAEKEMHFVACKTEGEE